MATDASLRSAKMLPRITQMNTDKYNFFELMTIGKASNFV
jgi:hypothetical protein